MKEEGFMQKITVKVDGMQCGMCAVSYTHLTLPTN